MINTHPQFPPSGTWVPARSPEFKQSVFVENESAAELLLEILLGSYGDYSDAIPAGFGLRMESVEDQFDNWPEHIARPEPDMICMDYAPMIGKTWYIHLRNWVFSDGKYTPGVCTIHTLDPPIYVSTAYAMVIHG